MSRTATAPMAALALGCLFSLGCTRLVDLLSEDPTRKAYVAQARAVDADTSALVDAVERYAAAQGWMVDEVRAGRVVAHVDARLGRTLQRDTWVFEVRAGSVSVRRRLSLDDGSGRPQATSDAVCGTYAYALEADHLQGIAEMATEAPPQADRPSGGFKDSRSRQVAMRRVSAR